MRVLIAGIDGYLGWPLAVHLSGLGWQVGGFDCSYRRRWVRSLGSQSAIPISSIADRLDALKQKGRDCRFWFGDLLEHGFLLRVLSEFMPEAIVHLAEQPSAPYSMSSYENAYLTQHNNVLGTLAMLHAIRDICPNAHLLKLGTMGEYGTPDCDIPEGHFPPGTDVLWPRGLGEQYRSQQPLGGLMFPRKAGSWYHLSKVHDTHNIEFACRTWGLRSTDVMQGVVYGTRNGDAQDDPRLATRYDYDQCFGTAINRFCAQAVVGLPITPYGIGGQKRGFLPLRDSIACMTLALENPPEAGEYRVFNQFDRVYSVSGLAQKVQAAADAEGLDTQIEYVKNPRIEAEDHSYSPYRDRLVRLGYQPQEDLGKELRQMIRDLLPHRDRIAPEVIAPDIQWASNTRPRSPNLPLAAPL